MAMAIIRFMTVSLILLFASALPARAQEDYRFAIGGGLGMTGYLGDANTANLLKNPSWDAEVLFDYLISPRLTLRTNFFAGGLRGNSAQMTNVFPNDETYKFSTTFYELSEMFQFNFFNYGMGVSALCARILRFRRQDAFPSILLLSDIPI